MLRSCEKSISKKKTGSSIEKFPSTQEYYNGYSTLLSNFLSIIC